MLLCHLFIYFGELSVNVFGPFFFFFLLLNVTTFLYLLKNSSLSDASFANIYSHAVACLLFS